MEQVQPFRIEVAQSVLDDLQARLANTRWTNEVEDADWDFGTEVSYMRELVDYWQHSYDWRREEAALNSFAFFRTQIDGQEVQFIHERGKGPNPVPLLLLHGWPDSVCRYLKLIPLLTDPGKYGGNPDHSFDVIIPSLFDTSSGPKKPIRKQLLRSLGERFRRLMADALGYDRFGVAGGDGGSVIAQCMAADHPGNIIGIHLTDIGFPATTAHHTDLSPAEQQYMGALQMAGFKEGAYAMMLGTKPLTFAYGLNDSPVAWAALVIEKFRTWSDCDGDIESSFTKDELLTNIMLYWISNAIDPRGYREEWLSPSLKPDQQIDVPTGVAHPPKDFSPVPPREFAARNLRNIQSWTVLPHGGHFVAIEDPGPIARDMQTFFGMLKAKN